MSDHQYTAKEKYEEIQRELRLRRALYPRWVTNGKITFTDAARQIDIMVAILADYDEAQKDSRLI